MEAGHPLTVACQNAVSVQVVNKTESLLRCGLQHSLRKEPDDLGAVEPGDSLWLPVFRREPGMLSIKPLGEQHPFPKSAFTLYMHRPWQNSPLRLKFSPPCVLALTVGVR